MLPRFAADSSNTCTLAQIFIVLMVLPELAAASQRQHGTGELS